MPLGFCSCLWSNYVDQDFAKYWILGTLHSLSGNYSLAWGLTVNLSVGQVIILPALITIWALWKWRLDVKDLRWSWVSVHDSLKLFKNKKQTTAWRNLMQFYPDIKNSSDSRKCKIWKDKFGLNYCWISYRVPLAHHSINLSAPFPPRRAARGTLH